MVHSPSHASLTVLVSHRRCRAQVCVSLAHLSKRQPGVAIMLLTTTIAIANIVVARVVELFLTGSSLVERADIPASAVVATGALMLGRAHDSVPGVPGTAMRKQDLRMLLERLLVAADHLALWSAIRDACANATGASKSDVYLFDATQGQLRLLVSSPEPSGASYTLDCALSVDQKDHEDAHIAVQAIRSKTPIHRIDIDDRLLVAAAIRGTPEWSEIPLAVVVLDFPSRTTLEPADIRSALTEVLDEIWPFCTYASIHFPQIPLHHLQLEKVLDNILTTLCGRLGFEFATISLVDEDRNEIRTVKGKNIPKAWIKVAHHPLDSNDIQAYVVRTGETIIPSDDDPRLDTTIRDKFGHHSLIRVFVPLGGPGGIGTIEAGFKKGIRSEISPLLRQMLERYARLEATVAIQNALLHKQTKRHARDLARLDEAIYKLQTHPEQDSDGRLQQLTDAAQGLFRRDDGRPVDLVLLYPREPVLGAPQAGGYYCFRAPIYSGTIKGARPLKPPDESGNIIQHIARYGPYFQPDVKTDPLLAPAVTRTLPGHYSFVNNQRVRSFAGVPLWAHGDLWGVLCLNYRTERYWFSTHQKQIIESFAQQAAAMVASHHLVREQARRQFEFALHDAVKTNAVAVNNFIARAMKKLPTDLDEVKICLAEARHTTSAILSGTKLLLSNLSPSSSRDPNGQLRELLERELKSFARQTEAKVTFDLDKTLPDFPLSFAMTIVWTLDQTVSNALQHAQADHIHVSMSYIGEELQIVVEDDGRGFDPNAARGEEHLGLRIIAERLAEVRGKMLITSTGNGGKQGTTVAFVIPLAPDAKGREINHAV